MQQSAWMISLVLMAAIVVVFVWVILGASTRSDSSGNPFKFRALLFWVVVGLGVIIAYSTLSPWPLTAHATDAKPADVVITATGKQWQWELSQNIVQAGQEVEFQVTSADVNHGFAIYKNKTRLLTQTQAMPGYVNKLRYKFTEPGDYELLCLEYCGLAHHRMAATIHVK